MLAAALGGTVFLSSKPEVGYPAIHLDDSCKGTELSRVLQAAFEPSGGAEL
jgi:GMP synthase-like glutamine amidotransferase